MCLQSETDSDKLSEIAEELCLLSERMEELEAKIAAKREEKASEEANGGVKAAVTRQYIESLVWRLFTVTNSYNKKFDSLDI